jgi:hypothetical protein
MLLVIRSSLPLTAMLRGWVDFLGRGATEMGSSWGKLRKFFLDCGGGATVRRNANHFRLFLPC